jgi:hypothetical protein
VRQKPGTWVLLAFRVPREPSTPRIAVWRKLKRLGVVQLADGVVALPLGPRTREQLEWVAQDVLDAGGEARIWLGQPATGEDAEELVEQMRAATALEYRRLIAETVTISELPSGRRRRSLGRLRRELRKVRERDYFPPPERELAQQAIDTLALTVETSQPLDVTVGS